MFWLLVAGAIAPLAIIPLITTLGWPSGVTWILAGVAVFIAVYALSLLPTKLILSDEGLCQKQLLSEFRLPWSDIVEWRYFKVQDAEGFWVRDRAGKKYDLKHWLVFGKRRSREVAEVMREKGIAGSEEYDA